MNDYATALIRTVVPIVVGVLVGWLAAIKIDVDTATQAQLTAALSGLVAAGYYAGARALEQRWPQFGWLLGVAKIPSYPATPTPPTDADPPAPLAAPDAIDAADYTELS